MPEQPNPKPRPHPWAEFYREPMPRSVHHEATSAAAQASDPCRDRGRLVAAPAYVELQVTSNFTFLTGASHPDELVEQAAALGHQAIAITDRNTLAGVVRAHVAAKESGIQLVVGCRLVMNVDHPDGSRELSVLAYPTDVASYGRLCRLLTLGKRRAAKGQCDLTLHDLLEHQQDLLAVIVPPPLLDQAFVEMIEGLRGVFNGDRLSLAASMLYGEDDRQRLGQLTSLAGHVGVPLVATNDVHYHVRQRRLLQDVLTCIHHGCTIEQAGLRLFPNAERCLKPPQEMARLLANHPQVLARTVQIARRAAGFNLDQLRYQYPDEVVPSGRTAMQHLADLTWRGAAERYGAGPKEQRDEGMEGTGQLPFVPSSLRSFVPEKVINHLLHELRLIDELSYAAYFLTVHDLVRFARSRGILCQGRGAAANSAVCYCLGVTSVDPDRIDLLFERFISKERNEPPDIDIDFEHERREEVIQYIYGKYGRERAAITAEVITYRGRSAVRDVGKVMGLSLDCVDRLAKDVDWWSDQVGRDDRWRAIGLDPAEPTIRAAMALSREILGFPRHLSQHVGGFVITRGPLCEMVPVENAAMPDRTIVEWDKDDIDAMGMLKVDVLGLGMLTCIRRCFDLLNERQAEWKKGTEGWRDERTEGVIRQHEESACACSEDVARSDGVTAWQGASRAGSSARQPDSYTSDQDMVSGPCCPCVPPSLLSSVPLALHTIPAEDSAVYDMICAADTIGVFQIESRAQMTMLPRLKPRCFYDLVIEVAIVRPGPIQGDMVHPYLRRRRGEEPVTYPTPEVRRVLGKTLGVPLFQEQAMSLAIVAAGFISGEADRLRRAMAAWKRKGDQLERFESRFIDGMRSRGYDRDFAQRCFNQLRGFSEYGFPESHAASFALLVYVSAWLKKHHPAAFAAALLNSQPMGFYAPAQIVRDAIEHGVEVQPVDVHHSAWDCSLEGTKGRRDEGMRKRRDGGSQAQRSELAAQAPVVSSPLCPSVPSPALRLGMRLVKGLRQDDADRIAAAVRTQGPFRSIDGLRRAAGVSVSALRRLAAADAFGSMGLDRQAALWHIQALRDEPLPIFSECSTPASPDLSLPPVAAPRRVIHDYQSLGLSLKAHPVSFLRSMLNGRQATRAAELADAQRWPQDRRITVAGLVLVRQRPATASGIVFMTIEDETGIANLIIRPHVFDRHRRAARHGVLVLARGVVERQGAVVHVMVRSMQALDDHVRDLLATSRDFH